MPIELSPMEDGFVLTHTENSRPNHIQNISIINTIFDEKLLIENREENRKLSEIRLYNFSGKLVLEKSLNKGLNTIVTNSLIQGVYVVMIVADEGLFMTDKLLKIKAY